MTHIDLSDKVILITGGSNGIGKAVADYLMQNGAKVAVHYNSNKTAAQALVDKHNNGSKAFKADLANDTEVLELFNAVKTHYNTIDAIILNAGVFLEHSSSAPTDAMVIGMETNDGH